MKKRAVVAGLITLMLGIVFLVSAQLVTRTIVKGDVNGDGAINIVDAIWTINIILEIPYPEPPASEEEICAADVNGDGNVNVLDVLLIVNVILYPDDFHFVSSCDELDCDDSNTCTQDYCDPLCIQCRHTNLSSGTPCDDGNLCTENDQCVDGNCQGTLKDCDDGNPCTDDSCDPDIGCIYTEVCCENGSDDDDDGNTDCADEDCLVDGDGDGHYAAPCGGDWDDSDSDVYPGAPEICDDGKDNDQDGNTDCADEDCLVDGDSDGHYAEPCGDDCNDNDASVHPGATEICDDTKDNDCDGDTDCDDIDCSADPVCFVCGSTFTDINGNTYQTVQIGDQCWMAENLKVTRYRNGDPIPNVTDITEWTGLSTGAYCNYNNNSGNVATYGRLYNWYAVDDSRNIAPAGWHVPTDAEWRQLEMYLGMSQSQADSTGWRGTDEGGKMKETGTSHWYSPNTGATNESGFSALPGGNRSYNGYFYTLGIYASFWSSTEYNSSIAWDRILDFISAQVERDYYSKQNGFSLRCLRDN